MTPTFESEDGGVRLYCGDARKVCPIAVVDCIVMDPVWPNAHPDLIGSEDPAKLFKEILVQLPSAKRLLVWLGVQSDPRFLKSVSEKEWPFLRSCYLSIAVPGYNGRCLATGDMLYCFGEWPPSQPGRRVLPGECRVTCKPKLKQPHPCARNEEHAIWVLKWWSDEGDTILDPQMGSGTTGVAAIKSRRRFVGIEADPKHYATAEARIKRELAQGRLALG